MSNPAPDIIRLWQVPNPYDDAECYYCEEKIPPGALINVEFEVGVVCSSCADWWKE